MINNECQTCSNRPGTVSFGLHQTFEYKNTDTLTSPCPGCFRLVWKEKPKQVLIVKKRGDHRALDYLQKIALLLVDKYKVQVLLEHEEWSELEDNLKRNVKPLRSLEKQDLSSLDLLITLGGDGTVLHSVFKFRGEVPPLMAFNLGTFNFLANLEHENYKEHLEKLFNNQSFVSLRMKLTCTIRPPRDSQRSDWNEDQGEGGGEWEALNDIVIDRGPSPFLTHLDCYCCETKITTVQADGLIVATPAGSTAYGMSAGGSIVHPLVPCLLFTPICPHSLSFRPLIFPSSTVLTISVPKEARANSWISIDGQARRELIRGSSVKITMSPHPVPIVCKSDETAEWFLNLTQCLSWNVRTVQRPLDK